MVQRVRLQGTPAQEQRRYQGLLRQEKMLSEEQSLVNALMQLISSEKLTNETNDGARMRGRQVTALFEDRTDQAISPQVMSRVLSKAGVSVDSFGRFYPWAVVESYDALDKLADKLRTDLQQCREDLGR